MRLNCCNFNLFFFFFLAAQSSLRDLSFPTRDQPGPSAVKVWSPNYWTARESPELLQFYDDYFCLIFLLINLFIIYGCVGSSFLCEGFL